MLPVELCNLIIDHLHDSKPSLLACSLVCRAWVSECRLHLFCKVILNSGTAEPFFQLLESPHATIASARTRELYVGHNTARSKFELRVAQLTRIRETIDAKLLEHMGILSRCPADVFGHAKKLSVTWAGWWTPTDPERLSIGQRFKNVRELDLCKVYLQTDEDFQALLASFPALEILSSADTAPPANLHTISLKDSDTTYLCIIRSLIPCPLLRVFQFHDGTFGSFTPTLAKELNRLLVSAGGRLEDFEFKVKHNDSADLDAQIELIDFARIPNLKRISFWIGNTGRYLIPLLRCLAESGSSTPMLETMDIHYLPQYDIDWDELDDILQRPYFYALREIKTSIKMYFDLEDVVGQERLERPERYLKPNDGSRPHIEMGLEVARFVECLPKYQARGIVRVAEAYHFWDLRD
ncbi:hypothetical protein IW261DRAFT_1492996 [Armillaria novae-zelandiae]|uniref:F-box/LRR-repeat protein 15/At3g58940/PEG3-like LRR domain-containing protein n=1 Tax=Armillaria novae-zelandiae TaxID=153914 RepID=A0AA39P1H5_9AGAR|nr:hypothetical protein IW261DRAFT_1492996 [Armillaria novae-zelandiae]